MKVKFKKTQLYKALLSLKVNLWSTIEVLKNKKLINAFNDITIYDFKKEQYELLLKILQHSKDSIPYYSRIFASIDFTRDNLISTLNRIPLLDKSIIRSEGEKMFEKKLTATKHKSWMNTGGSTGEPLLFPVVKNLEAIHQLGLYNMMGKKRGDKVVSVDGSRVNDSDIKKNKYWTYNELNFIYGETHFSVLYMNNETLPFYINQLNIIKPTIVRGYPSGLLTIANFLSEKNIDLQFKLKGIYLTSEYLDETTVKILSKVFKCPIYGQYGHAEASVFAFTKANDNVYYCSPLYGFTEILNEKGVHVSVGEVGEIVVTGFYNYCMPFIRYRTGDLAVYGGNVNGFVILKSLQGRTVDYIINKKGEKLFLIGLIFGGHLKCFENIKTWQLEQNVIGEVIIHIEKDEGYNEKDEIEIIGLFDEDMDILFDYSGNIRLTERGKKKFLIQNVKSND